jgi:serine/threonine protein kinase
MRDDPMPEPVESDSDSARSPDGERNVSVKSECESGLSLVALLRQVLDPSYLSTYQGRPDKRNGGEDASVERIGKFEVLGEIGRGGFGTVLLVRDPDLGRERALKVPNPDTLVSPGALKRFLDEARLISRIDHPNVVRVYEAETVGIFPYIVMEYCPEGSLGRWLTARSKPDRLPEHWVATLVALIADGVHQAHSAGLLHRDIKPANILLERIRDEDEHGVARFRPKIADFGLAKDFQPDEIGRSMTVSGTPVGTWAYMSPEQARGDKGVLATTDVYSIGAILYELLTGDRLYAGLSQSELASRLLGPDPSPTPTALRKGLHRDLETICAKCLEKAPVARYQSSNQLADDLRRFLGRQPIVARPAPRWKRATIKIRRHPTVSTVTAILVAAAATCFAAIVKMRADKAQELVHSLTNAPMATVPTIIRQLDDHQFEAHGTLKAIIESQPHGSPDGARAALALLRTDASLAKNLNARLLVCDVGEHAAIVGYLRLYQPAAAIAEARRLWSVLDDKSADSARRLRAACVLAAFDSEGAQWAGHGSNVAADLIQAGGQGAEVAEWARLLANVGKYLEPPLLRIMADRSSPSPSLSASWALAELIADRPSTLSALVLEADKRQIRPLAAKLTDDRATIAVLEKALQPLPKVGEAPLSRDEYAKRQAYVRRRANAVAALARLGRGQAAWGDLVLADDPDMRGYLIERLAAAGVPPCVLLDELENLPAPLKQTLIVALGEYSERDFGPCSREDVCLRLINTYKLDPGAGVHAAVAWLLRRWGKDREVDLINESLRSFEHDPHVDWCHNSEGHSLTIVRGPTSFPLFTSTDFTNPIAAKIIEPVTIPYTFGIATCEVSIEQFKRFVVARRVSTERLDRFLQGRRFLDQAGTDDRRPIERVSFYASAHYCLWLSELEGIPPDQRCYEPLDGSPLGPVRATRNYLQKSGYRVPTYEEWMYGLMAQGGRRRHIGPPDDTMDLFEWLAENSAGQSRPVGTKRPNDRGLHDMLGNLSEWCSPRAPWGPEKQPLIIGAHYLLSVARVRDWEVCSINPEFPASKITFRLARTIRGPSLGPKGSTVPP